MRAFSKFGHKPVSAALLGAALLVWMTAPASADAIDGQWCSPQGRHLKIDGPSIITPGGTKMNGEYGRHSFTYVIPAKAPSGGSKTYMVLISEEEMDVHVGSPVAKAERWKRCEVIS